MPQAQKPLSPPASGLDLRTEDQKRADTLDIVASKLKLEKRERARRAAEAETEAQAASNTQT